MSVRLILDTSALVAYAAADTRAIDLGELLLTVQENGDLTGIPAMCLIEAYQQVSQPHRDHLLELVGDDEGLAVLLPVLAADVATIAHLALQLPPPPAHATAETHKHHALLATYQRHTYTDILAAEDILDL
ncbi:hypothetical protein Rhe02_78490 [Rhizocola hellebori]|uniref:PIN domain-containing protein n=1 Tax=Rhizocola hellebori TaxID=1392758 RepID=A0A8J3QGT2_9ACTN|nr:hypothetical protein [Rhizocola hellebori]GIH09782.1 hypothetical protein Rhe02_78490 [Rhizocola hellebori]